MGDGGRSRARRISFGALLAVTVTIGGSIAMVAFVAPLLQRFWDKVEEPVLVLVEERGIEFVELEVAYEESQGSNSSGSARCRLSVDGTDGGDLRISVSATDLAFPGIVESAGWPPDVAGYFDGGLEFYRIGLVIGFSDGTRTEARATRIAVTDAPGLYFVFAPWSGGGKRLSEGARVLQYFDADRDGVCALAAYETGSLGRAAPGATER